MMRICIFRTIFLLFTFYLKSLRLGDFLLRRMAMEDVVVAFRRRTGPDVGHRVAESLHVVQISKENLVIDVRSEFSWLEEVDWIQIGDVDSSGNWNNKNTPFQIFLPSVWSLAIAAVLLNVQTKEADFSAIDHFEREHCLCAVREFLGESFWAISERVD